MPRLIIYCHWRNLECQYHLVGQICVYNQAIIYMYFLFSEANFVETVIKDCMDLNVAEQLC